MTQEEKAKAYDEAIRKLRGMMPNWERLSYNGKTFLQDLIYIIPELAESEDEKMRKELIKHLKELSDWKEDEVIPVKNPSYYRQWASWLEKQGQVKESTISQHEIETCKENVNSLTYEDDRIREALVEMVHDTTGDELWIDYNVHKEEALDWLERQGEHANFRNKIQVGDKVTRNEDGVLVNLSQLDRVAKKNEKQCKQKFEMKTAEECLGIDSDTYNKIVDECIFDEQKPADKVEPKFKVGDKIYLKPEYRMPNDDTPIANTVKEIRRIDDKHYRFDGSYIFIEDQDKYELVEQKPEENKGNIGGISANWSVEDMSKVQRICKYLNEAKKYYADITEVRECIECLESLKGRVLPKQEWSEEDEQHIDSLLKRLDALCRNKFERTRFAISEDRDWLKSLKPQSRWKPTGEQLGCLSDAIEYYNSSGYPAPKLKELYEQLKKLKEG